jgi:hypothetical protein
MRNPKIVPDDLHIPGMFFPPTEFLVDLRR